MSSNDSNVDYKSITENVLGTIDKHAPLKRKVIRGNQAPFMNRVGPLLFDFSINDLFFLIESSSIHNFADDNTLSAWANTISDLINKLESDSNIAIEWFKMNKMIVNPDKFQAIVLNKKRSDLTNTNF